MKIRNYLLLIVLLLILSMSFAQGELLIIEVQGEKIVVDETFCQNEVQGVEKLGSDFYLFCETNFEEEYNDQPALIVEEDTTVEATGFDFEDENTRKLLKTLSIVFLILVLLMIVVRHRSLKLHKIDSFLRLQPYLVQLKERGYSEQEIHDMLLKRGYEEKFINDFLHRK